MEIKRRVQALCLYIPSGWVDTGIPGSGMENGQQGGRGLENSLGACPLCVSVSWALLMVGGSSLGACGGQGRVLTSPDGLGRALLMAPQAPSQAPE